MAVARLDAPSRKRIKLAIDQRTRWRLFVASEQERAARVAKAERRVSSRA